MISAHGLLVSGCCHRRRPCTPGSIGRPVLLLSTSKLQAPHDRRPYTLHPGSVGRPVLLLSTSKLQAPHDRRPYTLHHLTWVSVGDCFQLSASIAAVCGGTKEIPGIMALMSYHYQCTPDGNSLLSFSRSNK